MTTALIDGDIVAYRCAASVKEDEDVEVALYRTDKLMLDILSDTASSMYICYISGEDNFRYKVYPDYKANRRDLPRPVYLQQVREHLVVEWGAKLSYGIETDDELGLAQTDETIICSIDKDLLQIPGRHWNFVKKHFMEQTYLEGKRWFWTQMLAGDRSDNIPGFDGKFRQTVPEFINKIVRFGETEEELFESVWPVYKTGFRQFLVNGMCLHILQRDQTLWLDVVKNWTLHEELKQEVDQMYASMKSLMDATQMGRTTMEPLTFGGPANGTVMVTTPTLIAL